MLLAAMMLALQQPTTPRLDLTYGFATESLEFELTLAGGRQWAVGEKHDPMQPSSSKGLILDCGPDETMQCEMRRIPLNGCPELWFVTDAEVPSGCVLCIDARTAPYEGEEGSGAWVRAWDSGTPVQEDVKTEPGRRTLEVFEGHLRVLEIASHLQLRIRVHNTTKTPASVTVDRVCYAGFDRSRISKQEWVPSRVGYGIKEWAESERNFREASRKPHPLAFCSSPALDSYESEASSAAACLVMLLPRSPEENLAQRLLSRTKPVDGFVDPGRWLSIVRESGERAVLACFSIWPAVEMALGGAGPLAVRVRCPNGAIGWVVLSAFDEQRNALVYDPSSEGAQPVRWTRDELEKRWFGAGGLAFRVRR